MAEDISTPPTDASATPPSVPATGNPASSGATPEKATALTLEEALKRVADLEHSHGNAKEELDRHRKKLSAYEKAEKEAEATKKAAEDATLSEIDRIKKHHGEIQAQYAEAQSQHQATVQQLQEQIVSLVIERQAAKLGMIDPEVASKLLNWAEMEYEENGRPKNATKLLEKLIKEKPYLASQQTQTPPPTIPAMNPGRTSIAAPGVIPPGQITRLSDVWKR